MRVLVLAALAACGGGAADAPPPRNTVPVAPPAFESKLSGEKRVRFDKYAGSFASACGRAHSLLTSLARDPACTRTPHALRYLERMVALDGSDEDIHHLYEGRYGTRPIQKLDVSHAALVGSRTASAQLVVFEDLECPHCADLAPMIEAVEAKFGQRVAVYYKHFPLTVRHALARGAAIAAVAADRQGKFLPMTKLIFADQRRMSAADLEADAKQLGLDLDRYRRDVAAPETAAIVDGDLAEADALGLDHVPVVFINGRQYDGILDQTTLFDAVDEELEAAER